MYLAVGEKSNCCIYALGKLLLKENHEIVSNQCGNQSFLIGKNARYSRITNGKPQINHCRGAWGHLSVKLGLLSRSR